MKRLASLALLLFLACLPSHAQSVRGGTLQIKTQILPPATVGQPYDEPLVAGNGTPPYTWHVLIAKGQTGLPKGITLGTSGAIGGFALKGQAAVAGTFTFTLEVTDRKANIKTLPELLLVKPQVATQCALPSSPVGVGAGEAYKLQASGCGASPTWSVKMGQGTVDQDGTYHAPSSIPAYNYDRGYSELPNAAILNQPIDQLPVDPHSARWLERPANYGTQYLNSYHAFKAYPAFYHNDVNAATKQQKMHALYPDRSGPFQDALFPVPGERDLEMECGFHMDAWPFKCDRHLFNIGPGARPGVTSWETEQYGLNLDIITATFTPGTNTGVSWTTNTVWQVQDQLSVHIYGGTGAWAGANGTWRLHVTGAASGTLPFNSSTWGPPPASLQMSTGGADCPTCNTSGATQFRSDSYAAYGGVDAASLPVGALSLKSEEWHAATLAGTYIHHALRTTLENGSLSCRSLWPALGCANSQLTLDSAVNGNPTVIYTQYDFSDFAPCDGHTYTAGCSVDIAVYKLTGAWAAFNGDHKCTLVDTHHVSCPVDSSQWGKLQAPYGAFFVFDWMPYGARLRLTWTDAQIEAFCSTQSWCADAKTLLKTFKYEGLVMADGTYPADNWDTSRTESYFHPQSQDDAVHNIRFSSLLEPFENSLEVVDESSLQTCSTNDCWLRTNQGRVVVQVCASATNCATEDVVLQGTTIGTPRERLLIAAGVQYPLPVWVNGPANKGLNFSLDGGIPGAQVSTTGVISMPNCTAKAQGVLTVSSQADPAAAPLYVELACLPKGADGHYRLALGKWDGDYVDSHGNAWIGSFGNVGFNASTEQPGIAFNTSLNGTWQGITPCKNDTWAGADSQLFSRSTNRYGDTKVDVVLPSGTYDLTLNGEAGFGGFGSNDTCGNQANENAYDWSVQGQTVASWVDGYNQAGGNYKGYSLHATASVGADSVLSTFGRMRLATIYGMSWSSLDIAPHQATLTEKLVTSTMVKAVETFTTVVKAAASVLSH
jgi:hypothetical protein